MKDKSLEDLIRSTGNPIDYLRNSQVGIFTFPVVPAEFTSWRMNSGDGARPLHLRISHIIWLIC